MATCLLVVMIVYNPIHGVAPTNVGEKKTESLHLELLVHLGFRMV